MSTFASGALMKLMKAKYFDPFIEKKVKVKRMC
jgi:hypothetical protein